MTTFEVINAVVGILTILVVAVTAVAAMKQLRHLRASNQLAGLLKVLDLQQEHTFRESAHFVRSELAEKMNDPDFRSGLERTTPDLVVHKELWLAGYFEQIGNYVKYDLIGEEAFMDQACDVVISYWQLLSPAIDIVRKVRGPGIFDNFEFLVARAQAWVKRYPDGNYPRNIPRVALYTGELKH